MTIPLDLVIWDSHPLSLGATPVQVFIDGIPQLTDAYVTRKPDVFQRTPEVPNYDKEAKVAVEYEGLPPLEPKRAKSQRVLFTNVRSTFTRRNGVIEETFSAQTIDDFGVVVVENGKITCSGTRHSCVPSSIEGEAETIDLKGGSVAPGLTTFGSSLGLSEIDGEPSTGDGLVYDPLIRNVPSILGNAALARAVDALQFGGRSALLAYRSGVVNGIAVPYSAGFYAGLSTTFSTGALSKLDDEAVIQDVNAVHVKIRHFANAPSISTQVGALRRLLLDPPSGNAGEYFKAVANVRDNGDIPRFALG